MGREAAVYAEVGHETGDVKALLESRELILRGAIRRTYLKTAITGVRVDGDDLRFTVGDEDVVLRLGTKAAHAWALAIEKPPPSLRTKLGLGLSAQAFLVGTVDDADLAAALDGVVTGKVADASLFVAIVDAPRGLTKALQAHAKHPALAIWVVYPKGKDAAFGDSAIRTIMRETGFRDTKSCAVSDRLTGTRYNPIPTTGASLT